MDIIILKQLTTSFYKICANIVQSIGKTNKVRARPRIVIVICGHGKYASLESDMKESLLRGWVDTILHLTLIFVQPEPQSCPIHMYSQPFEKMLYKKYLKQNSTLSPKKLKDMQGQKLAIDDPSYRYQNIVAFEELLRYRTKFMVEMDSGFYLFIKYIFFKVYNCIPIIINFSSAHEPNIHYRGFLLKLKNNKKAVYGLAYKWYYVGAVVSYLAERTKNFF